MKTGTVVILIIAAVLVIIGAILFMSALFAADFDYSKLSTEKFEISTHTVSEAFENITIECETADVTFKTGTSGICTVECTENEKLIHTVKVEDGTLIVSVGDEREWYDHITFFGSDKASVVVYLPEVSYSSLSVNAKTGDVYIPRGFRFENVKLDATTGGIDVACDVTESLEAETTTGDVELTGVSAGSIAVSVTTGDIEAEGVKTDGDFTFKFTTGEVELESVTCKSLKGKGSTGSVSLENVIAEGKLSVKVTTGDVVFEGCDAGEIYTKTTTGSVKGTLLTEKVFLAETSTGNVNVPKTTSGGKCEITTTTGDIRIRIK